MSIAFDAPSIRRVYNKDTQTWWFSVIDVVQVLTQQADYQTARKYWNQLKERLSKQGSESVTNCHRLTLPEADGKQRLTDAATAETLLRLVQSVPHLNAEPFKFWLAKLGDEYMQEMADPALFLDRARQTWQQQGRSEEWITQRMTGQVVGEKPTDYMSEPELIFASLAELSARQIAESVAASGMVENKSAAQSGDHIAAQARQQLERQMGRSVVSGDSPQ
jgi:DNA-damage-inducible protein D